MQVRSRSDAAEVRCPYCRERVASGQGIECSTCGARHHAGCFEEHGSCSTHACGSKAAGAVANPDDALGTQLRAGARWGETGSQAEGLRWLLRGIRPSLECRACGRSCADAALVARCGCNEVMHAECWEARGSCPGTICRTVPRPVHVMSPAQALLSNRRDAGASLKNLGAIFGLPLLVVLGLALSSGSQPGLVLLAGLATLLCAASFALGLWLRGGRAVDEPVAIARTPSPMKAPGAKG